MPVPHGTSHRTAVSIPFPMDRGDIRQPLGLRRARERKYFLQASLKGNR